MSSKLDQGKISPEVLSIFKRGNLYLLLAARIAPVMAPLVIEFQGSSFPLTFTKPQSIMEKRPPHTAKLPATHTHK